MGRKELLAEKIDKSTWRHKGYRNVSSMMDFLGVFIYDEIRQNTELKNDIDISLFRGTYLNIKVEEYRF